MNTPNRTRTVLTLAAVAMAIFSFAGNAASAATITLTNPHFNTDLSGWTDVDATGGGFNDNYQQHLSSLPNGTLNQKGNGGNYVQQVFNSSDQGAVDATTFGQYTLDFDYGYRRDGATNGDITLRFSLWNTTDNAELAFDTLDIADPGVGTNFSTAGSVNLNYNNTAAGLVGDAIALRITHTTPDLNADSFEATSHLDNLVLTATAVTAVPEPSSFALAALGLLGLVGFRRRRRNR